MIRKVSFLGYLIIQPKYLTWTYLKEILSGKKKLIRKQEIALKEIPPR